MGTPVKCQGNLTKCWEVTRYVKITKPIQTMHQLTTIFPHSMQDALEVCWLCVNSVLVIYCHQIKASEGQESYHYFTLLKSSLFL